MFRQLAANERMGFISFPAQTRLVGDYPNWNFSGFKVTEK